jgi:hypothetical protein
MPFAFAWMLHGNDEGQHKSGRRQIAVNWVMPAGGTAPGPSPKTDGDSVFTAAGELMWPWRFEIEDWWAVDAAGALKALATSERSPAVDRHATYELLEAEIYNRCARCEDAFSPAEAYLRAGVEAPPRARLPKGRCAESSLPHVFTPLTHLPAALSQDVLGMVRGFACDAQAGPVAYAPQFLVRAGGKQVRFIPSGARPGAGAVVPSYVTVDYTAAYTDGQPYAEVQFSVMSNYAEDASDLSAIAPALQASDVSEVGARVVLASNALSALAMLGAAAANGAWPAGGASPGTIMSRALGPGLLRMENEGPVTIWERLPGADFRTGDDLVAGWTESSTIFAELKAHYDRALADGSATLLPLKPLFEPPAVDNQFAAAAAGLLDNSVNARVLMVAWLAATALAQARSKPSEVWDSRRSFAQWYEAIADIVGEHEVAELLAGWWRHWAELISGAADARVRQMRTIVDGWIRGKADRAEIDQLASCYAYGVALLASLGPPAADMPADLLRPRIEALHDRLRLPDDAAPESLGEDRDLAVVMDVDPGKVKRQDELLRGYAIAMAAGYDKAEAGLDWQWLTDLAGSVQDAKGRWEDFTGPDGKRARFHDAIGAISEKGRSVVAFPYDGKALHGAMRDAGADSDGVDGLSFGWPADWKTPPLAYGLRYWVRSTPIGNAGKILDDACARKDDDRRLKDPEAAMFSGGTPFRYLCRVAPGAVTVKHVRKNPRIDAYAMETDSRAWHEQAGARPGERVRVAVIRPGGARWRADTPTELEFELVPPDGTPKVIERWIGADIAQRKVRPGDGADLRDPAAGKHSADDLASVRDKLLAQLAQPEKAKPGAPRCARHPAVRAIGVEVDLGGGLPKLNKVLARDVKVEEGYLGAFTVTCAAANASSAAVNGNNLRIELAPGAVARLTLWTLAPETFFASGAGVSPLVRMANFPSQDGRFVSQNGVPYRAFCRQQHWFECAPDAAGARQATKDALAAAQAALAFVMDGNDAAARIAVPGGVDATWLKGFLVQRHDWHWTGYPLALPRMLSGPPTLREWSEAFAGTESLVESRVEMLQTVAWPKWRFGLPERPAELCRARLPGLHGARFVACVLRPLRRFDAWLENDPEVENLVAAQGRLVAARVDWNDPALRLPPPAVRAVVPLVRTYEAVEGDVLKSANGALLCLDDVLFRTDSLARFGGVGETVDVDLEETRINNVFEIGPNPIMHAGPVSSATILPAPAPGPGDAGGVPLPTLQKMELPYAVHYRKDGSALPESAPMDWRVEAGRPFGLTYDLDRNPKVAATAIVVRPVGADVASYWIMAKVRLRRMLDPGEDWTANGRLPVDGDSWLLARRPEGDDRIPYDFALACDPSSGVRLAIGPAAGFTLGAQAGKGRRLLCSWHKGHWKGTSEALWGLQVLDQVLRQDAGQWTTVERHSPYETTAATDQMNFKDPGPVRLARPAGASAQRLLLSDYGQAHWLTFIGMPFRHPSYANESFWMAREGNAIELKRSGVGYGVEAISRDLLINPVAEADLGGTPGSERVGAEPHTFHLLLVFERVNDIAAPSEGNPLGQLAGVYKPTRAALTEASPYPPLRFVPFMTGSKMPAGSVGYIYKFQGTVSDGKEGKPNPDSWEKLLAGMFPDHRDGEATVRWLPEFVGPIGSGKPADGAALKDGGIRIDLGALGRVDLKLDPQRGWQLTDRKGAKNPWQDDIKAGPCTLRLGDGKDPALDVEGGGGRLLARLHGWNQAAGGSASAYDDMGAPSAGNWQRI